MVGTATFRLDSGVDSESEFTATKVRDGLSEAEREAAAAAAAAHTAGAARFIKCKDGVCYASADPPSIMTVPAPASWPSVASELSMMSSSRESSMHSSTSGTAPTMQAEAFSLLSSSLAAASRPRACTCTASFAESTFFAARTFEELLED